MNSREQFDDTDGCGFHLRYPERFFWFRQEAVREVFNVDAGFGQYRVVRGGECNQSVRRGFDSTVSPNQMVAEIQAYLVDVTIGRNHQGGDQIVPSVGTELVQRNLRTGEDDRFLQTFQHEG